jgi:hypothetical protein
MILRNPPARIGLCATCQFKRLIESDRGSVFFYCERSKTNPQFPKYPRLPVVRCSGYVEISGENLP